MLFCNGWNGSSDGHGKSNNGSLSAIHSWHLSEPLQASAHQNYSIVRTYVLLIGLTLIAWGSVPWGAFQYDDFPNVVRDPATTNAGALAERLLHGLRPLTRLSYFLDAQLFGLRPAGFLTTNLLLHLGTVLLVFTLARRRINRFGACIAALLFALQPANGEVVGYVSGRSTGLMTPLLLGALLLHDQGKRAGSLILFTLACLAKEVALVFPALVLVWEMTRAEPRDDRNRALIRFTIAACAIFALIITLANYRWILAYSFELRSLAENLLANGRAIPIMFSLWIRPWALSPDHNFDPNGSAVASIGGLVLLGGLMIAAIVIRRRHPMLAFALAWPLIALLPTNSIIPKIDLVTERPLYLAWVGPSIALGAAVSIALTAAISQSHRRALLSATALLLVALAGASFWRAALWRNPMLLWMDATAKAPGKSRCWNNLGMTYLAANRDADAVSAFERAIHLDPQNQFALSNLATARLLCGDPCRAK